MELNIPDDEGDSPLLAAVSRGKAIITKALLDAGADCNQVNLDGQTPLMVGLSNLDDSREALEVLLSRPRGFDFFIRDNSGRHILHYLMENAGRVTLELFSTIEMVGVSAEDRDNSGKTPRDILTDRMNGCRCCFPYSWTRAGMKEAFDSFLDRVEGTSRISLVDSEDGADDDDDEFYDTSETLPSV
ncbi:hypothetical protein TWF481_007018 [Arthrobotrys musiformis]|uniref:Uncharacterized protein n=1 Tax=Arthrobotrys musiformis TaxID=47236 RepID=A0AAV9WA94_9PEZI